MSRAIDNGGAAFPIPNDDRPGAYPAEPGMDLRDWFAGQALASLAGADGLEDKITALAATPRLSIACYRIADAMIAARKGDAA